MPDEDARLTDFLPEEESDESENPDAEPETETDAEPERHANTELERDVDSTEDDRIAGGSPANGDRGGDRDGERDSDRDDDRTGERDPDGDGDRDGEVTPAVSTADWAPGGEPCEGCGGTVERRWRDDGALVCGDCKEW